MTYQPIKLTKEQYRKLKSVIRHEFGNVSVPKGLYIITYLYQKYVPKSIKDSYRKKYYQSFSKRRSTLGYGRRRNTQ